MQFQAAYFPESLKEALFLHFEKEKVEGLLHYLSYFEVEGNVEIPAVQAADSVLAVAHNLISRALPAKPSIFVEDELSRIFQFTEKYIGESGQISYPLVGHDLQLINDVFNALHIIEPRLNAVNLGGNYRESWEKLGSRYEKDFLTRELPLLIGNYFIQLLEVQRDFAKVVHQSADFTRQPADFVLEFPYPIEGKKGVILEVDGILHKEKRQMAIDQQRDEAARAAQWIPLRLATENFGLMVSELNPLRHIAMHDYFKRLAQNYRQPFFNTAYGLDVLQFALTPVAVARLQKLLLELIISGRLPLDKPRWNLLVVEQDVPCARLAIDDLQQLLDHLFALEGKNRRLPAIELTIITTRKFEAARLNRFNKTHFSADFAAAQQFDLLIDMAVLQRKGVSWIEGYKIPATIQLAVRSVHAPLRETRRKFYTSERISYPDLLQNKFSKINELRYFLQNIFRKHDFREHQAEMVNLALQQRDVVVNLPPGSGKTLAAQLAAFLQPGIVVMAVPSKPAAVYQGSVLEQAGIDCHALLSFRLPDYELVAQPVLKLQQAEVLIVFVLPQLMHLQSFRQMLQHLTTQKVYFGCGIISQAECLSLWSDSFRTDYYQLPQKMAGYFKTHPQTRLPLIGLSATVDGDVWTEIKNAFPDSTKMTVPVIFRKDIHYQSIKTNSAQQQKTLAEEIIKIHAGQKGMIRCLPLRFEEGNEAEWLDYSAHPEMPLSVAALIHYTRRLKPGGKMYLFPAGDNSEEDTGDIAVLKSREQQVALQLWQETQQEAKAMTVNHNAYRASIPLGNAQRSFAESRRAVLRLAAMGMIDDFVIDFQHRTGKSGAFQSGAFHFFFHHKGASVYEHLLADYFSGFFPVPYVTRWMQQMATMPGENRAAQCLNLYIQFLYEHIEAKHRLAARRLKEGLCHLPESGGTGSFLELYTTARYALESYTVDRENYSLAACVAQQQPALSWMWDFMEIISGDKSASPLENMRHVLESCSYLLNAHPAQATLLIIKSFALLSLDQQPEEAKKCLFKGLLFLRETHIITFGEITSLYKKYLSEWKPEAIPAAEQVMNALNLQPHLEWLKNFNATFLAEYDR